MRVGNGLGSVAVLIAAAGLAVSAAPGRAAAQFSHEVRAVERGGAQHEQVAAEEVLPIRRITLYRSGVGYFERAGSVPMHGEGKDRGGDVQLRFGADQINDILKSMVVLITDGRAGRLDSVSYGSKEPLSRRLGSFAINIADNPGMAELLNRLRGERVKLETVDGAVSGTVLGVEMRVVPPTGDSPIYNAPHLNLVTDKGLRSIALTAVRGYELVDEELAAELNRALAVLAEQRAERVASVDLRFSGNGDGGVPVTVGYVHETPVWKTSYRLVLPETSDSASREARPALVQGWAIVENTTDQDWEDVSLGLVSGRPVSFTMDLHEPLFAYRPQIPVPTVPGVTPKMYAMGMKSMNEDTVARGGISLGTAVAPSASPMERSRTRNFAGRAGDDMEMAEVDADAFRQAVAGQEAWAAAGEVGEVFRYDLAAPVTIERQRSAMIPIINADLEARRVSIYSANDGGEHPLRGVELTNSADLQLLPGPISVYDGSAYAGDAQIGHIGQGDERLLAYAVDLDMSVQADRDDNRTVRRVRIVRGTVEQQVSRRSETVYDVKNNDETDGRTLLVEHPRYGGWNLASPEKASETTDDLYRFEVVLAPGEKRRLGVVQERVEQQSVAVTNFDLDTAVAYHRTGAVSDEVLSVMREVARRQRELAGLGQRIEGLRSRAAEIDRDQSRLRSNMQAVSPTSELYARYLTKLSEQETELERIAAEREDLQATLNRQRSEFETYVNGLNVG